MISYLLSDPGGHREEPENRQGLRRGAQGRITLQLAVVPHSPRCSLGVSRATCGSRCVAAPLMAAHAWGSARWRAPCRDFGCPRVSRVVLLLGAADGGHRHANGTPALPHPGPVGGWGEGRAGDPQSRQCSLQGVDSGCPPAELPRPVMLSGQEEACIWRGLLDGGSGRRGGMRATVCAAQGKT